MGDQSAGHQTRVINKIFECPLVNALYDPIEVIMTIVLELTDFVS